MVFKNIPFWIMDTGSGLDLIRHADIVHASQHIEEAPKPVTFKTANGGCRGDYVVRASMPSLKEEIMPLHLRSDSGSLISGTALHAVWVFFPLVRL